jgi:hypothetical protein
MSVGTQLLADIKTIFEERRIDRLFERAHVGRVCDR